MAGGGPRSWRTQPRNPTGFPGPDWAGEMLAMFPPILRTPKGPSRCGNPSPPPTTPQGYRSRLASTSPPSSLPPRTCPVTQGFLPSPWVLSYHPPTQHLVGALVAGRRKLHVLPLYHPDSAPLPICSYMLYTFSNKPLTYLAHSF